MIVERRSVRAWRVAGLCVVICLIHDSAQGWQTADRPQDQIEFFETRIRPVLVEHCYECHNSAENAESGLELDHRGGLQAGGDRGPILDIENPDASLLLETIRHELDGLEMPQEGPKLSERTIADFREWIAMGAPDPRDDPPSANQLAEITSWQATLERRKNWWSLQPIERPDVPALLELGNRAPEHPIDRFIVEELLVNGLDVGEPADSETLVRRLYLTLIGLPPTSDQARHWSQQIDADREQAIARLVDELLDSPQFGEKWARHWMDWIRYAESHGSEGDPRIDNAWHYRDYLIRALNEDVSYDQLVREHVAGDLLERPRINTSLGINESAIGTAHWRMVFHGFAPTDALDERVRFTDDQINAFSKAFLGLTVSCARCHDHKFDAISQADYYALFGILASCRPARTVVTLPENVGRMDDELTSLKREMRDALKLDWIDALARIETDISASDGSWTNAGEPNLMLYPFFYVDQQLREGASFEEAWSRLIDDWQSSQIDESIFTESDAHWEMGNADDYRQWFATGRGLPHQPSGSGDFSIAYEGPNALTGVYPAGVYSNSLTQKHPARLSSDDFVIANDREVWMRVIGGGGSAVRYVVQDYPRNGTVFPVSDLAGDWRWQRFDLSYWEGDSVHLELTTGMDAPLLVKNNARSWFGIREAVVVRKGLPAPGDAREHLGPILDLDNQWSPSSKDELQRHFLVILATAIENWSEGRATDRESLMIDACLRQGILPNAIESLQRARPVVEEYRRIEQAVEVPIRVPGLEETHGEDHALFVRGDHRRPSNEIPRRFLEAIDATPYDTPQSGRLELAEDLLRDDNPLTRRVIVNRVWHHLFGRGIVATPDNFGRLGQLPSHPELLDWLAVEFTDDKWSLKELIRMIVLTEAWQRSSMASSDAAENDPDNRLLSHFHLRRLEAEAIRDSFLMVSGSLDNKGFGPPADGDSTRRSVYVRVIRNALDPFLRVFDFPEPFSSTGRRDETNVPAQSLTLLNDPRVQRYAAMWAQRIIDDPDLATDEMRIDEMFWQALGRAPTADERDAAVQYLREGIQVYEGLREEAYVLQQAIDSRQHEIREMLDPVRSRLQAEIDNGSSVEVENLPQPIARWDFETDFRDAIGDAHGQPHDGAEIVDGAVHLRNGGHVTTSKLALDVRSKTIEAWVQLDSLDQRGGGVVSLQSPDGSTFDAIVFGERDPQQWLAGSNFFNRTQPLNGDLETAAVDRPVHIAIVYHEDGRIACFRDGEEYGEAYQSSGPVHFRANEYIVSFGVRHLPAQGNRLLSGKILLAQLYDRALTADEITLSFESADAFVSEKDVLDQLPDDQRNRVTRLRSEIANFEVAHSALGSVPESLDERAIWSDFAHALFLLSEFIYVK